VHRIRCDDTVCDLQFVEQLLRGGKLVGLFRDINIRPDRSGFDIESVNQLRRPAVVEIVEASPGSLAVRLPMISRTHSLEIQ
jgi:hypothetical protein